jgi:hypothetical protein
MVLKTFGATRKLKITEAPDTRINAPVNVKFVNCKFVPVKK